MTEVRATEVRANRSTPAERTYRDDPSAVAARGGLSWSAVLTGAVVSLGAFFLLSALVAGLLAAFNVIDPETGVETVEAGVGAGVALVLAQFLAYLWGGYTAGRMGRGAGALNGSVVPIVSALLVAAAAGLVAWLGASVTFEQPFRESLPVTDAAAVRFGVGLGIAALVAMFLGGVLGGIAGARWHRRLEREAFEVAAGQRVEWSEAEPHTVDLSDDAEALRARRAEQAARLEELNSSPPEPVPTTSGGPPPTSLGDKVRERFGTRTYR